MSDLRPYWRSDDGAITVFHARCEDVIAAGLAQACDLVHADPVYGVSERTERLTNGRSNATAAIDFPALVDDDKPYDPTPLLALARPLVLWGANHYAPRVPESPSWIFWDKKCDTTPDDNADGELAWTNLGGPLRVFRHLWRGMIKASERTSRRMHPTQKPIALSTYVFQRAKLKSGALVFVPYLGSGPDLPAARAMGLRVIACDVESWCCKTAVSRLQAITPEEAAKPVGPLFERVR